MKLIYHLIASEDTLGSYDYLTVQTHGYVRFSHGDIGSYRRFDRVKSWPGH